MRGRKVFAYMLDAYEKAVKAVTASGGATVVVEEIYANPLTIY